MSQKEWFASWFDTSYYHLLYDHRNDEEAAGFIDNLLGKIQLPPRSMVLDLACGKGRHARMLQAHGLSVLGVDLSEQSITEAKKWENEQLKFKVHDMRERLQNVKFDAVFNLFTSFGYFEDLKDNDRVLSSVHDMLNSNGIFVLDYLNAEKVLKTYIPNELVNKGGIEFHIERKVVNDCICKQISFEADSQSHQYMERVQLIKRSDFETLLSPYFKILHVFGDFDLNPFNSEASPRLILMAQKI